MRLTLVLPTVEPESEAEPSLCPYSGCGGYTFDLRQEVPRRLRDTRLQTVVARRYVCRRCGHTFRFYPPGVGRAHTSARLQGAAVVLYLLGLSYGSAARLLTTVGYRFGKTSVFYAVQALGERALALRRRTVQRPAKQAASEATADERSNVRCPGQLLTLEVRGEPVAGLAVTLDIPDEENVAPLRGWLGEIAALIGAEWRADDGPLAPSDDLATGSSREEPALDTAMGACKLTPAVAAQTRPLSRHQRKGRDQHGQPVSPQPSPVVAGAAAPPGRCVPDATHVAHRARGGDGGDRRAPAPQRRSAGDADRPRRRR